MKRIAGEGSAIRGLTFVDDQLWLALQDGRVQCFREHEPVSVRLEDSPVALIQQQGQLWFWGRQQLSRLDLKGNILTQQAAPACHCLCQRGGLLWTASPHEVCCYQLFSSGWKLLSQFSQLSGTCWSFDVSQDGSRFLRVWPAEGNRWQVGVYDSGSGQLLSQFKRGSLWLQAVFAPDDFTLMVSGWLPQQVTAISYSGGACSQRHHLHSCGWSGPIYHFDRRVVVVTQAGLQTYQHASFPPGQPEYAWSDGYQATPHLVVPAETIGSNHRWHKRYSDYAGCTVTAVASSPDQVALGHLDGTVEIHNLFESSLCRQSMPVRAWGGRQEGLLLLNPRDKTLVEVALAAAGPARTTHLPLDDYWPSGASEWGQLYLDAEGRLVLRDRYGVQSFDLERKQLLWKHEPSGWSPATRLLAWEDRLYLDQALGGVAWIDLNEGTQHSSKLASAPGERLHLFQLGDQFLVQTEVGPLNFWAFYCPDQESLRPLSICPSWCQARVSACGGYVTLSRHQVPPEQSGNVLLLDRSGLELGRWQIPWGAQIQAEPALQSIFAVSREQLLVYDFGARPRQRLRGHGGPIHWYQVDCSARCLLSLDEFGWVRRWSLTEELPGQAWAT
ncbi:MAG: hypothetical protein U0931_25550 [Vulcanimicrobiota bacterium]